MRQQPDSEPAPVRDHHPLLPWFPVLILAYALAFLALAGLSIKFYQLGHADRKEIRK